MIIQNRLESIVLNSYNNILMDNYGPARVENEGGPPKYEKSILNYYKIYKINKNYHYFKYYLRPPP